MSCQTAALCLGQPEFGKGAVAPPCYEAQSKEKGRQSMRCQVSNEKKLAKDLFTKALCTHGM